MPRRRPSHPPPPFEDRADAGRKLASALAERLGELGWGDPIVLALPRGGVPVGYEVARALRAPLDVVVARKIGAPQQPELGIGAVAWGEAGGLYVLHAHARRIPGVTEEYIGKVAAREEAEARRRLALYRGDRPEADLSERTAILVDDGLATGVTARAAILALRECEPRWLVLAVPVCAHATAEAVRPEVDDLVCPLVPRDLEAVGLYYASFEQTTDDEVISLLNKAREETDGGWEGTTPSHPPNGS